PFGANKVDEASSEVASAGRGQWNHADLLLIIRCVSLYCPPDCNDVKKNCEKNGRSGGGVQTRRKCDNHQSATGVSDLPRSVSRDAESSERSASPALRSEDSASRLTGKLLELDGVAVLNLELVLLAPVEDAGAAELVGLGALGALAIQRGLAPLAAL